ncbi:MAG: invasion associated locus B family protein [Aestuariivita sp.]|nr:invasion associated locus B family protein [Aestuariivita sp.]MCY4202647.1 invasion associated locus B family protein [Aestuariivita sp.]MCY4288492.1 invasion associated locus B family protein [Aestuariivita sp.]MCY4347076.1 invasion associated locus B family protein [Aestuariivita sp.]
MGKNLLLLFTILGFTFGSMTKAQDTAGSVETANPLEQLDMGESADAPRIGQRYIKEKFGAWDLVCVETDAEKDPCSITQVLTDQNANPVAEFSMFRLSGGDEAVAAANVVVPLETLLTAQLLISVDGAIGRRYNYSFCHQQGCVAQVGFNKDDIASLKNGLTASIELVPAAAPNRVITLNLSLSGFIPAYEAVDIVAAN